MTTTTVIVSFYTDDTTVLYGITPSSPIVGMNIAENWALCSTQLELVVNHATLHQDIIDELIKLVGESDVRSGRVSIVINSVSFVPAPVRRGGSEY